MLAVYYSATGNTESVANDIAAALDADVFELEPVDPYTEEDLNWTDDNSRVVAEYENEDERDVELVSTSVDNWEEIDTVFIGYPKMERVLAVYSVYQVTIQPNIATQYTKHRKKCYYSQSAKTCQVEN